MYADHGSRSSRLVRSTRRLPLMSDARASLRAGWWRAMMSMRVPLAVGTILSAGAVAAIASQDPGPVSFTRLSARRPVASYLASAAAPFGNGWELFALIALIFSVCVFVAGLLQERRGARRPA